MEREGYTASARLFWTWIAIHVNLGRRPQLARDKNAIADAEFLLVGLLEPDCLKLWRGRNAGRTALSYSSPPDGALMVPAAGAWPLLADSHAAGTWPSQCGCRDLLVLLPPRRVHPTIQDASPTRDLERSSRDADRWLVSRSR
jgi:hypothetical protein